MKKKAHNKKRGNASALPTRAALLRYVSENPTRSSKRDIARAFHIKGTLRKDLKKMLRTLHEEGVLVRKRKRLRPAGELPAVSVLTITGLDADGELIARPNNWPTDDSAPATAPRIVVVSGGRQKAAPAVGQRILARLEPQGETGSGVAYTARPIKILPAHDNTLMGVYRNDGRRAWIEPIEKSARRTWIAENPQRLALDDGDLVRARARRTYASSPLRASIEARLAPIDSDQAVARIAMEKYAIAVRFPDAVQQAAAAVPADVNAGEIKREDWRDYPFVTIDPVDAKDHDDAVFAVADTDTRRNPGGYIVCVAIADVSAYVPAAGMIDDEALRRGNSVYFPNLVAPMLPERLSNNLCSLREGEDRPALCARLIFNSEGVMLSYTFHRITMRSRACLAYEQAQNAIDGHADAVCAPIMKTVLRPLWAAYEILARGRAARLPLELDAPERKLVFDADNRVCGVHIPARLDAHRLIEEFMIQANVAAAKILEKHNSPLLYRIHDAPSLAKLESLRDVLRGLGYKLAHGPVRRPERFNALLHKARGKAEEQIINEMILRSQAQACYAPDNIGHFGLNLRQYAHFTSPIRRYADLIVHRAIIGAIGLGSDGLSGEQIDRLDTIAQEISAAERRAMAAERETVDRLICGFLADRVGARFSGRIAGVTRAGLFIRLDETGADGFVPAATIGDDYYAYDQRAQALVGRHTGIAYALMDRVQVRLMEAAPVSGALRFSIVDHTPGAPRVRKDKKVQKKTKTAKTRRRGRIKARSHRA